MDVQGWGLVSETPSHGTGAADMQDWDQVPKTSPPMGPRATDLQGWSLVSEAPPA